MVITIELLATLAVAVLILLLAVFCAMANNMRKVVYRKGYDANSLHIFAWCFWVPFFGYLYAIALPDLKIQAQNDKIIKLLIEKSNNSTYTEEPQAEDRLPEL